MENDPQPLARSSHKLLPAIGMVCRHARIYGSPNDAASPTTIATDDHCAYLNDHEWWQGDYDILRMPTARAKAGE